MKDLIAMDIGGANIKIFDGIECKQYYFPLWKKKDKFKNFLQQLKERWSLYANFYAITMTAELCDCFKNRKEGVKFVLNTFKEVIGKEIFVLSNDTNFKLLNVDEATKFPYFVASANFIGTAKYISNFEKNAIVVDIGSTTTDIIPIKDKKILAHKTDLERLKNDELIYTGVLRTNVVSVSNSIKFKNKNIRTSAEHFASMADVYKVLEEISDDEYTTETADGKGKSKIECMRRIARIVCSDLIEDEDAINDTSERKSKISMSDVVSVAKYLKNKQIMVINKGIKKIEKKYGIHKRFILGTGKFLYDELNASVKYNDISAVKALYFLTYDFLTK